MSANLARLAILLLFATLLGAWLILRAEAPTPIRIGVVHALSGVMADSERGLVDATRLAVEELNANGGVLGRPVEMLIADSRSDWGHAAAEAERLIRDEKVSALFACWTSSCRQAVRPVVEKYRHLMFYPLQYEGMEQSPNIIYMGAAPNQQIIPGARWAMDRFGPKTYLLGSDYLFPRAANLLIRELIQTGKGHLLAERYQAMTASDFSAIAEEIRQLKPDVVLNTLNGASNRYFFAALAAAGLGNTPVVSFSIAEPELQALGLQNFHPEHFAVWGYFQSLPGAANQKFVAQFRQRFGTERVTSDPILSSHDAVLLWATAVREAGTADPAQVNRSIGRVSIPSPAGIVATEATTRHLWRRVYVGKAQVNGQFEATEISEAPVRPAPFPSYRSRAEWLAQVKQITHPATPADKGEK
ncbi:urea ABC transporter substrate-binding protein [Azonexus sp.]|uniref:urea ABC transporter substrate-binding protein n=1 Tax=Azonexus sp. TaxID=1872668 RepID=UPI0027BA5B3D|nr:urea ABC transporter substrate-binding protein [Azonexus sp.]